MDQPERDVYATMSSMVKIVYRSLLKDLTITCLLTLAFLNSIMMMEKLLRLSRLLSGVGASLFDMAKMIILIQPQLFLLTIPMALLLSTLLVYGRMNMDSEIIILKASGMNFRRISVPVIILGIICFIVSITVSFYIGPKTGMKLREELTKIVTVRSTLAIEEGTFNTLFKDLVIIVKGKKGSDTLEDIFLYDNRNKGEPRVLMAKEGRLFTQDSSSIGLYLKDGYMNITKDRNATELFFQAYKMTLSLETDPSGPKKTELTPSELLKKITSADTGQEKASLYLEFDRRLSLPAVCLILIFLGPPLALMSGKSGRLGGLAIGLLVFTAYYMILIYGENLVTAGQIPHYIGAWGATLLLGIFAGFIFWREGRK